MWICRGYWLRANRTALSTRRTSTGLLLQPVCIQEAACVCRWPASPPRPLSVAAYDPPRPVPRFRSLWCDLQEDDPGRSSERQPPSDVGDCLMQRVTDKCGDIDDLR